MRLYVVRLLAILVLATLALMPAVLAWEISKDWTIGIPTPSYTPSAPPASPPPSPTAIPTIEPTSEPTSTPSPSSLTPTPNTSSNPTPTATQPAATPTIPELSILHILAVCVVLAVAFHLTFSRIIKNNRHKSGKCKNDLSKSLKKTIKPP